MATAHSPPRFFAPCHPATAVPPRLSRRDWIANGRGYAIRMPIGYPASSMAAHDQRKFPSGRSAAITASSAVSPAVTGA